MHGDYDGMTWDAQGSKPGRILELWAEVRKRVGVVEAKRKAGMRFDTRAATDLVDKLQAACNELGVLVYPSDGKGEGKLVEDEDGKLNSSADVQLWVVVQAVEDGSALRFWAYGQGMDNQDKAGGKAGTYAFKQALIQALLAGGSGKGAARVPDTDDEDTPVKGGPRARRTLPKEDDVRALLEAAQDEAGYRAALVKLKAANPATQVALRDAAFTARARCIPPAPVPTE